MSRVAKGFKVADRFFCDSRGVKDLSNKRGIGTRLVELVVRSIAILLLSRPSGSVSVGALGVLRGVVGS